MTKTILKVLGPAAIGAAIAWGLKGPQEVVRYERVEVPVERIIEQEPDTVIRWRERLVIRTVEPTQIATATGGAMDQVTQFCRPQVLTRTDTVVEQVDPMLLLRSISVNDAWFGGKDRVSVTGPTNYGDLVEIYFHANPGWSARTVADSVLIREDRWYWLQRTAEILGPALVGYGFGKIF